MAESNAPGAFLVFLFVVTCPRPPLGQKILVDNLRSFSVYSPDFS